MSVNLRAHSGNGQRKPPGDVEQVWMCLPLHTASIYLIAFQHYNSAGPRVANARIRVMAQCTATVKAKLFWVFSEKSSNIHCVPAEVYSLYWNQDINLVQMQRCRGDTLTVIHSSFLRHTYSIITLSASINILHTHLIKESNKVIIDNLVSKRLRHLFHVGDFPGQPKRQEACALVCQRAGFTTPTWGTQWGCPTTHIHPHMHTC